MNQLFAAGALLVITLTFWGLGKKPKTIMIKGISREIPISPISLVKPLDQVVKPETDIFSAQTQFNPPITSREKFELKRRLKKLISSNPDERLIAVEMAGKWGDSSVIPILKIGLRDMDSRVVIKAAKAISKFRNHPISSKPKTVIRYPLNVFLMR